jgi:hypothetical protein
MEWFHLMLGWKDEVVLFLCLVGGWNGWDNRSVNTVNYRAHMAYKRELLLCQHHRSTLFAPPLTRPRLLQSCMSLCYHTTQSPRVIPRCRRPVWARVAAHAPHGPPSPMAPLISCCAGSSRWLHLRQRRIHPQEHRIRPPATVRVCSVHPSSVSGGAKYAHPQLRELSAAHPSHVCAHEGDDADVARVKGACPGNFFWSKSDI